MEQSPNGATPAHAAGAADAASAEPPRPAPPPRVLFLVRHGQTTFNVEGRLPGQLEGVALTDLGRRQAFQAAVALSALPLSAVISSPLERALDTARAIARGGGLDVRTDPRLMDTDVGHWAGRKIADLEKADPAWKAFVAKPTEPPPGVESLAAVQERAVAVCEEARRDASLGNYIVLVAHADIVKLILARYMGMHPDAAPYLWVDNASISALAFDGEAPARVLAVNWTSLPAWLAPPPARPPAAPGAAPAEGAMAVPASDGTPPGDAAVENPPHPAIPGGAGDGRGDGR